MAGIKETKEMLEGLGAVAVVVAKAVKGGGSPSEIGARIASAVVANPEAVAKVKAAADGISAIPEELKDLSLGEILELCNVSLGTTRAALEALKGK